MTDDREVNDDRELNDDREVSAESINMSLSFQRSGYCLAQDRQVLGLRVKRVIGPAAPTVAVLGD